MGFYVSYPSIFLEINDIFMSHQNNHHWQNQILNFLAHQRRFKQKTEMTTKNIHWKGGHMEIESKQIACVTSPTIN